MNAPKRKKHHHKSHLVEHHIWRDILQRCTNSARQEYKNYGGRGITVCERWNNFPAFFEDMGLRPTPKHSIERIDSNGNYEPKNCRWATMKEQLQNTRKSRRWIVNGKTYLSSIDAAAELGVNQSTVVRWCNGRYGNPPKEGCKCVPVYPK